MLVGWVLLAAPAGGNGLHRWSYDLLHRLQGTIALPDDVVMIQMDDESSRGRPDWSTVEARATHAQLIQQLNSARCKWIGLDVWLADRATGPATNADVKLLGALRGSTNVVLVSVPQRRIAREQIAGVAFAQFTPDPPHRDFLEAVSNRWGASHVALDPDFIVRRHFHREYYKSLAWSVAALDAVAITKDPERGRQTRWIRYYGPHGAIASLKYGDALEMLTNQPAYFRDKIIFIGGYPNSTTYLRQESDTYLTPFGSEPISGVEIQATMFWNLKREDWLERLPRVWEFLGITLAGAIFGARLVRLRPTHGAMVAGAAFLLVGAMAVWLFRHNLWFPWLVIGVGELPCAYLCAVVANQIRLQKQLEQKMPKLPVPLSAKTSKESAEESALPPRTREEPLIHGHLLLRLIGEGGFGKVWLARNDIGMFVAVKIVSLEKFSQNAAPYGREFHGVERFMPISRKHPNFVHILAVERRDERGFFYYVMEAADDEENGPRFDIAKYSPRSLTSELKRRGVLPVRECIEIMLPIISALQFLHEQGLIHRDVKPSNIIFVEGVPKLADIGLVTEMRRDTSGYGTLPYMPEDLSGNATWDVYSVGKVLYQMSTGQSVNQYPNLPSSLAERPDRQELLQLNEIFTKAAAPDSAHRYQTMAELRADLLLLLARIDSQDRVSFILYWLQNRVAKLWHRWTGVHK